MTNAARGAARASSGGAQGHSHDHDHDHAQDHEYRAIFDATSDAVLIGDLNGYVVEANAAACRMYGYTHDELVGMHSSALIHPDYYHDVSITVQTLREGGSVEVPSVGLRKDGTPLDTEGTVRAFTYRGAPHILVTRRDVTERVRTEERLRETEAQYRSIFNATSDGLLIVDMDGVIVEANPAFCAMYGYTREELIGEPGSVVTHPEYRARFARSLQAIRERGSIDIQSIDLHKDGTPIHFEARGTMFTYRGRPHALAVVRDITERVQAYELLEERVAERTRELSTLLEVSQNVVSSLELQTLLELILDQLSVVTAYSGAAVLALEGAELVMIAARSISYEEDLTGLRFSLAHDAHTLAWVAEGRAIVLRDVREDTPPARAYRAIMGDLVATPAFSFVRSWLAVPLTLKERVIGMISLVHAEPGFYTEHHASLVRAVANQAAVAIENSRLYARAQEAAAIEERQRLGRELHDSVSQALYGIALGAATTAGLLDRDPARARQSNEYVRSLVATALAEMRALIFELRPESLESEGLVAGLHKQAEALRARHEIAVDTALCDEPAAPLHVKEALYRIAQEALHNTIKHAQAQRVEIRLEQTGRTLLLEVRDDGAGFDATGPFPGHLGLRSMAERAARLGGTLEVESTPGCGTRIRAHIPVRPHA